MIPRDYEEPVSFWEWVRSQFLLMIPLVGLVLLFYWAFSDRPKASKRNFARAQLFFVLPFVIVVSGLAAAAAIPAFQKVREAAQAKLAANNAQAESSAHSADAPPVNGNETAAAAATAASDPASSSEGAPAAATPSTASAPAATPAAPPTLTPDEPTRSLRSADGRTIDARVVSLTDDEVTIMRVNGQQFTIPISRFAPQEVAYFMRLRNGRDAFE